MQQRVAIIGGGISGLTAAYRLHKLRPDVELQLFEASAQLGGKLQTERLADCLIEVGADSFLSRKPRGVALCQALGIDGALIGRNHTPHKTTILQNGVFHDLPEGLTGLVPTDLDALHNSTLLSPAAIARIGQERYVPARLDDEDESLSQFVTRRFGAEAYSNLMQPLMGGIYSSDGADLSIAATFPQLRQLEQKFGSILAGLEQREKPQQGSNTETYPPFLSLLGGMRQLIDALAWALPNGIMQLSNPVRSIVKRGEQYSVQHARGVALVDGVIVATEAGVSAEILHALSPTLSSQLRTIPYGSTNIITFIYENDDLPALPHGYGYGFLVAGSEQSQVRACTISSNKWSGRAPAGKTILRFFARPGTSATDIQQQFMHTQLGVNTMPLQTIVHQWQNAIPQYTLGHTKRIAILEADAAQHAGLMLTGAYFDGVGIPDCIRRGENSAEQIAAYLNPVATISQAQMSQPRHKF